MINIPSEDDFRAMPDPPPKPPIPPEWDGDVPVNIYGETEEESE